MTTPASQAPHTFAARFGHFARAFARTTGHPFAFVGAVAIIIGWALMGPLFHFSDTWQLVINTGTTIITFLMVFLIQNTQNRESQAVQVKLDELIRAVEGAHNTMLDLEDRDDEELDKLRHRYAELAARAREDIEKGEVDTRAMELDADEIQVKAEEIGEKAAEIGKQVEAVKTQSRKA